MKLIVALGFFSSIALGAEPETSATPESVLVNQKLTAKVEEVEKKSLHIKSEDGGFVYLAIGSQSFVEKSQFIFFRRRGTRLQMIAMGVVQGERENPVDRSKELIINVDKDSIVKYPQVGDISVPLADPMSIAVGDKRDNSNTPVMEEPIPGPNPLPGYLQFGLGLMSGNITSDAPQQNNGGKNASGYRFKSSKIVYYSGYFPIGIEIESHAGDFPTKDYNGLVVHSAESVSKMSFYYRFKPWLNQHIHPSVRVFTLSDQLTTDNADSQLLNTNISALGVGTRIQYQFASDVWQPEEKKKIAMHLQNIYAELGWSPSVTANDLTLSRGTASAGSSMIEYRLGTTLLFWFKFIPLLKRWVLEGSYGARKYALAFQGPTISEVANPIVIPQGLHPQESETDYRFYLGIRIIDPLEALFSKGEKKKSDDK